MLNKGIQLGDIMYTPKYKTDDDLDNEIFNDPGSTLETYKALKEDNLNIKDTNAQIVDSMILTPDYVSILIDEDVQ